MPYYSGTLRARLIEERDREQEVVKANATVASGAAVMAELERDGWIERG